MIICVKNSTRIFSDSMISGWIIWSLSRNNRQIETHKKVQHQVYCYVWSTKWFRLDTEPFEHSIYGYGDLLVGIVRQVNAIWNTDKNMIQTLHQIRYGIIYEYWQIPLKFSNCCKYELSSFDGPFCCSTGIFRYQAKMIMSNFDCCKRNNIVITKSRVNPNQTHPAIKKRLLVTFDLFSVQCSHRWKQKEFTHSAESSKNILEIDENHSMMSSMG